MRIWFLAFFLLFLAACAPQPTAAPTLALTPSPPPPTSTPAPTRTSTPTPTPTPETITLTGTFGLPEELAVRFKGAERFLTRAEDGSFRITAFSRDPESGQLQPIDLELLPDTFSANEDLKNALAPLTVRARLPQVVFREPTPTIDTAEQHPQRQNTEYTLIWTGEEFWVAYQFPTLVTAYPANRVTC